MTRVDVISGMMCLLPVYYFAPKLILKKSSDQINDGKSPHIRNKTPWADFLSTLARQKAASRPLPSGKFQVSRCLTFDLLTQRYKAQESQSSATEERSFWRVSLSPETKQIIEPHSFRAEKPTE